jgi:hypothetical protein
LGERSSGLLLLLAEKGLQKTWKTLKVFKTLRVFEK